MASNTSVDVNFSRDTGVTVPLLDTAEICKNHRCRHDARCVVQVLTGFGRATVHAKTYRRLPSWNLHAGECRLEIVSLPANGG